MVRLPFGVCGLVLAAAMPGLAQSGGAKDVSVPASQLSPAAAYQEAMRPLEITRRSIANWSDTEQTALGVAIKEAMASCGARKATDYTGDALVDLGRLCGLGQAFPKVIEAEDRYLAEAKPDTTGTTKPRMAEAYAAKLDAQLHLQDEKGALKTSLEMLGAVPYGSAAANATNEALDYMELLYTADALAIAAKRQPLVLALLHPAAARMVAASTVAASTVAASTAPAPLAPDVIAAGDLYRQGLALAELQQLMAHPEAAEETMAALEAAVPADVAGDESIAIATARRLYGRLGKPLPAIEPLGSLDVTGHIPEIPARRAVTALLLFPDWCAQCLRMAQQMPESVFTVEGHEGYVYGLLAQTVPAEKVPKAAKGDKNAGFNPAYAADYLAGTPTVTVSPKLLEAYRGADAPVLIVIDSHGIVRLIEGADENALQPGKTVDSAVGLIGRQWPTIEVKKAGASSHESAATKSKTN